MGLNLQDWKCIVNSFRRTTIQLTNIIINFPKLFGLLNFSKTKIINKSQKIFDSDKRIEPKINFDNIRNERVHSYNQNKDGKI